MLLKNIHLICIAIFISITMAINYNQRETANAYVDALLNYLQNEPEKRELLDPLHLPAVVKGKHTLHDIKITGLSNLRRSSDALVMSNAGILYLIIDITARNVSVTMDCSSKMLFFEVQGDTGFVYDDLSLRLVLAESDKNFTATLLKVIHEGNYYVKYNGYIMIGSLQVDLNNVLHGAREIILSALEKQAKEAFDSESSSILPYLDERFRNSKGTYLLLDYE